MRETDDAGSMIADFDTVADFLYAEFALVEFVDDDAILEFHIQGITFDHVPRFAEAAAGMEADDLNVFNAAIRFFPAREILHVLFGLLDTRSGEDFVIFALREGAASVEIADSVKNDPEICVGMVNVVGSGGGEAKEEAKLNEDQDQGKDDSGEGDHETDAVVKEIASSKKSHRECSAETF